MIQKGYHMAITVEQIHATADQLAGQGIKPTQTAVREALGGGSFTTIAEALRTWRAEQDTTAQLQAVVIPQDITDRTQTLTAMIWETAQALASERLSKEREALEHKEALMNADLEDMQKVVATLEQEQGELTAQLDSLTTANAEQSKQIDELNKVNIQQGNDLQKANDKLLVERDKSAQLQDDLKQAHDKLEHQSQTIATLTADNAKQQAEKQAQADTIERLKGELDKAQQAFKNEQERSVMHLKDLSTLSAQFANLQGTAQTLKEQLTKAEALTASQADKIERLTADNATANAQLLATREQITKAQPSQPKDK